MAMAAMSTSASAGVSGYLASETLGSRSSGIGSTSIRWKIPRAICERRRRTSCQGNAVTSCSLGLMDSVGRNSARFPSLQGSEEIIRAAKKGSPPIMPAVITPAGTSDLSTLMLRNRIIFIGQPINSQVAQRVISQLMMLAALDEKEDIKIYINCPGGSTYSVLAIYDCMSWIKPKISTVCFGMAASQGALILAGATKGMRFAMPNARIMIHQPQGGCGGTMEDVRRQVNEVVASRDKIDKMYAAFTGQPLEKVQMYTERDHFFSAAESMEFGLIDGLLETEY